MRQSESVFTLGPPVALVPLARPAVKPEPPNLGCSWPEDWVELFVSSYLVVGRRVIPMIYGEVMRQTESVGSLALVALARPGGKLEPPNSPCLCPEDWAW